MKTSSLYILFALTLFIVFFTFPLVFGHYNAFLEIFIPNVNELSTPKSFSDLGDATAITGGILSAIAIILALFAIIDQKSSTKQALFCQNALTSLEILRNASLVEYEGLNEAYRNYLNWYSLDEYEFNRAMASENSNEILQKYIRNLESNPKTDSDAMKLAKNPNYYKLRVSKTFSFVSKRNMYRKLHATITNEMNTVLGTFVENKSNQEKVISDLIGRIREEMNIISKS